MAALLRSELKTVGWLMMSNLNDRLEMEVTELQERCLDIEGRMILNVLETLYLVC